MDIENYKNLVQEAKQLADYRGQLFLALKRQEKEIEKSIDAYIAKIQTSLPKIKIRTERGLESLRDKLPKALSPFKIIMCCTDTVMEDKVVTEQVPEYIYREELYKINDIVLTELVHKLNLAIEEKNGN